VQTWKQDVPPRTVIATDGAGKSLGEMADRRRAALGRLHGPGALAAAFAHARELSKAARAHPAIAFAC
jgi:hypothetical protein